MHAQVNAYIVSRAHYSTCTYMQLVCTYIHSTFAAEMARKSMDSYLGPKQPRIDTLTCTESDSDEPGSDVPGHS